MPQQISGANGIIIIKSRRLLGYVICLLGLVCLFSSPAIFFVLIVENLDIWIDVVLTSTFVTTVWIYLPAVSPTWTIFIAIDCIARLLLIHLFLTYWSFWHLVWINETPIEPGPFPPFVFGKSIGKIISIITSYIISFALWRLRWRDYEEQRRVHEEQRRIHAEQRRDHEEQRRIHEEERRIHEEHRRNHEEACRRLEQQAASAPELITKMPCPPKETCPDVAYKTRSSDLGVYSHGLRKLYLDSMLEEKEVEDELRL
ncbi:hypothetical protein E4T44_04920 [Aureobasidium sp. EXF-8845]|nr:hypothetical protein E4T44_04920 [Aureobasidium sp. EXF-8845]KAI4848299.1 hypothetical protein E4T45_06401 [Aureobasidium sp. EXF-8846]